MFDLTKEITLDPKGYKLYQKFRLALYILAVLTAAYLVYLILFPHKFYSFSFLEPNSNENSLEKPEIGRSFFPEDKKIKPGERLYFDATPAGDFSEVEIMITLNGETSEKNPMSIYARKSYEEFLKKEKDPIGFKSGTLLKESDDFYIISQEKLRKFSSFATAKNLGYSLENFWEISKNELSYNPSGETINFGEDYPEFSLFEIKNVFYILENDELHPFSSKEAFLSQYSPEQTVKKDDIFLKNRFVSKNPIGFADGSLISFGDSAYLVSSGKIYPIDNPVTFQNKGFSWEDIITASSDELELYEKTKLFNINDSHPDGIVYKTDTTSKYFILKDSEKHPLLSENIAKSWLRKKPIIVSSESEEIIEKCELKKKTIGANSFSCQIPLEKIQAMFGSDYEFELAGQEVIELKKIEVNFKKDINKNNLKSSLLTILNRIKINYAR